MTELPLYEKIFYVYEHRHPEWLHTLISNGYSPDQWVRVIFRGLSKAEARSTKTQLIKEKLPIYNKCYNSKHWSKGRSVNKEQVSFMKALKQMGYGYGAITHLVGGDKNKVMSIWRQAQYEL